MTHITYCTERTYSYITGNQYTHFTQDPHFTSLPIFHFPPLLQVSSPHFKNPSLLFTYNYFLTIFLKISLLEGKVTSPSTGSCLHSLIVLFTMQYLPISVLCFLGLILRLCSSLLRQHGPCNLSPTAFHALSPAFALNRAQM